jgi:DNA-binding CsgD family transcriptional regulator
MTYIRQNYLERKKIAMTQFVPLSKREREVTKLLLQGKSNKLMASSLGISVRTVEFHLKNIYTKFQVSSRIELILKLGNATGMVEIEKLGYSTVDNVEKITENRSRRNLQMDWSAPFRDTISIINKELEMKNLFNTKHVPVGVITALFTGFLWVAMFRYFVHMSLLEIQPWIVSLMIVWGMIGLSLGFIGKRNDSSLLKVCFSTLLGTGLSPISILPLMGFIVLPLGKLAEWMGLINRTTISSNAATTLAITAMIAIWLAVGIAIGIILLFVTIKKTEQKISQMTVADHRL